MLSDFRDDLFEKFRSARVDLNPGVAPVRAALPYVHIEDFELSTEAEYQIENFREKQRVDDVPGKFYDAARHERKV